MSSVDGTHSHGKAGDQDGYVPRHWNFWIDLRNDKKRGKMHRRCSKYRPSSWPSEDRSFHQLKISWSISRFHRSLQRQKRTRYLLITSAMSFPHHKKCMGYRGTDSQIRINLADYLRTCKPGQSLTTFVNTYIISQCETGKDNYTYSASLLGSSRNFLSKIASWSKRVPFCEIFIGINSLTTRRGLACK